MEQITTVGIDLAKWASPDIPDTFDRWDDDIGGVQWNPQAIDALSSCDVVFGCTDDQIGREVLNTAVYVYAQPYIDVGLGGLVSNDAQGTSIRPSL